MANINLADIQKRKLNSSYIVLYFVTKLINIRTTSCIEQKMLYLLYGIDKLGNRQVLGIYFDKPNDNRFWLEAFEDIKARGTENVIFLVTPANRNIERCIKLVYNNIKIVKSPEDVMETIIKYFSDRPSRTLKISFKNLFLSSNLDTLNGELQLFKDKYAHNRVILMLLERKENEIKEFYQYNYELRKFLYPYYAIRDMKKFLNKLNTSEKLCSNLSEVIEFCLPYINKFEKGRSQYKEEWLNILSILYDEYPEEMEVYIG